MFNKKITTKRKPLVARGVMYHMILSNNYVGLKRLVLESSNKTAITNEIIQAKYELSKCTDIYKVLKSLCNKNDISRWEKKWHMNGFRLRDTKTNTDFMVSVFKSYDQSEDALPHTIWVYINSERDILKKDSETALYLVLKEKQNIEDNISSIATEQNRNKILNSLDNY